MSKLLLLYCSVLERSIKPPNLPTNLSRIRFIINLRRLFDSINNSRSYPASPPITTFIRLINTFTRLK